jgi:hypothetical protein
VTNQVPLLVPRRIRWLFSGAAAIVVVVALAVWLRSPLDEAQALAASFDEPAHPAEGAAAISTASDVATGRIAQEAPPASSIGSDPQIPSPSATGSAASPSGSAATRELRDKLTKDIETGNHRGAVTDIDALMTSDAKNADDRELRNLIVDLAMRIMVGAGPEAEQLFSVVSEKMGSHGDDILLELVTTRGGSRAARRAEELLMDPKIFSRGTPAMRVAFELRVAPCDQKPKLFERAKADGDARALGQLTMLNQECRRRSGSCCLHKDPKLKDAVASMRERLGQ